MTKKKKLLIAVAAVAIVLIIVLMSGGGKKLYAVPSTDSVEAHESTFHDYLTKNSYEGRLSSEEIVLDVFKYSTLPAETAGVVSGGDRMITWTFDVSAQQAGFYNLELGYTVPTTQVGHVYRKVMLDGAVPYQGLSKVEIKNSWGDWSVVPEKSAYYIAKTAYLTADTGNSSQLPLFYLSSGKHTLTFEYIDGTMLINSLVFKASPNTNLEPSYQEYLADHHYNGLLSSAEITVDVFGYTADEKAADMARPVELLNDEKGVGTGDNGTVTWPFTVAETGFYNLEVVYQAIPGTNSDIQRRVLIDGETPYEAAAQIVFKRIWRDEDIDLKNGNEIRPTATEIYRTQTVFLEDYNRRSGAPLVFYLEKGDHTLSFEAQKEDFAVIGLTFKACPETPKYAAVLSEWQSNTEKFPGKAYSGDPIIAQAERRDYDMDAEEAETAEAVKAEHTQLPVGNATIGITKSSPSITVQKNYSDANLVPFHSWHILYPTIGATSWQLPGDAITWEINAPEAGLYVLTFKGRQTARGVTSYRRLLVNGEVPFAEAGVVGFDYSGTMQNYTLATADGTPYYVYLNEGSNTITLECILGSIGGVLSQVEDSLRQLNSLYLSTIQITGQVPSQYIDYEIAKKLPDFVDTMMFESERLFGLVDQMVLITGEKGENTAMLEKMAIQAEGLANDPEKIVEELGQFKNNIAALGTWINNISTMPLELDSVILSKDTASLPVPTEGFFQGLWAETSRFFATFFNSTSSVVSTDSGKTREITVWMASSGREQAQIIQNMIDETFVRDHDFAVKLQLIPMDVVLRAALAGNGPDVVIGLGQGTAQDFAMRGAIVDLSTLPGYEEFMKGKDLEDDVPRYPAGVMRAATYNGGVYGIPEQVSFQMFFYRQDVMDELNIENVPTTWDEVMELIPVLNRKNYEFYMPSTRVATGLNLFSAMVYQNGGEIYQGTEGVDYGIASNLASPEAMEAFKWFTDLFTVHGLEVQADFNNRFRTGEMPMGVTDYTTYCTLEIFAPEIKGLWSFAPLPGTVREDGTIDNTYVCDTVQTVIMNGADDKEAAWEFVQWWNDTAQQLSYAQTLESIMGTAARYPAADPEVIAQLGWSNTEREQLLSQYKMLTSIPAVPGYYMNTRMVSYAFDDVVADLANPRETLYLNIRDIDKELTKKREEFGLVTVNTVPATDNGANTTE